MTGLQYRLITFSVHGNTPCLRPSPLQTLTAMPKPPSDTTITIQAPATLANLGPGFDSFGLAVSVFNTFRFTPAATDSITLTGTAKTPSGDTRDSGSQIQLNPSKNLVFQALDYLYAQTGQPRAARANKPAFVVSIEAPIPLARGMGSSSTAIAAGLLAANQSLGSPFSLPELCRLATELEGHPDNVVPALRGGVWLCDATQSYPLPWPDDWAILLVIPPYPIETEAARAVMPDQLSREDAIYNLRKASLLTYALLNADTQALSEALDDRIHQPYRGKLIPEFDPLKAFTGQLGSLGTIISGSGSTMAVFCRKSDQQAIATAIEHDQSFSACQVITPAISIHGAVCSNSKK